MIADTGAKTLVVLNPADAAMFKEQYGAWGLLSGIEIVTATAFIAALIADGKLKVKKGRHCRFASGAGKSSHALSMRSRPSRQSQTPAALN